jgi:hypothetical protein
MGRGCSYRGVISGVVAGCERGGIGEDGRDWVDGWMDWFHSRRL